MKLSLCLILIILVVCYEANAGQVCRAVEGETISFLLNTEEELKKELEEYNAPPEAVEAKLKVKRCVNQIIYGDRFAMGIELVKVFLKCGLQAWLQMEFPANGRKVCEAVMHESMTFILESEELKKELEPYYVPPEAVEAKQEV
ncbi:prostatic steroid-binding protein C2-like [Arvicanthis niloticus]|uniref:prostatic steroid-binding protein C2-like n=1 Tax=Arvicanthis niloticus TaxID=61156 RepID=UPI001485D575|nr:prostatic steroid-binding protein C2-like [Arvicanthis niloticus]